MKRKIFACLLIILLLCLSGCTDDKAPLNKTTRVNITSTSSSDGYWYDSNQVYSHLTIENIDTKDVQVICNAVGCTHSEQSEDCLLNRFSMNAWHGAIYNTNAFFIGRSCDDDEAGDKLYMVDTDGNNLHSIYDWEGYTLITVSGYVTIDNHLYMSVSAEKKIMNDDGWVTTDGAVDIGMYDLDMQNGTIQKIYQTPTTYCSSSPHIILCSGDKICTYYEIQTKSFEEIGVDEIEFYNNYDQYAKLAGIRTYAFIYDVSDAKYEEIELKIDDAYYIPFGFINDTMYFWDNDGVGHTYNLNDRQIGNIDSNGRRVIYEQFGSDFLLKRAYDKQTGDRSYSIILEDGTEHSLKRKLDKDFCILCECSERVKLQWMPKGAMDVVFDENQREYVSKSDFMEWFD